MEQVDQVWVFCGAKALFPSGIFLEFEAAERWIESHSLTGTLTAYPVNTGVYEWAIAKGYFRPARPHQTTPAFIQRFSSASMEHHHYENGRDIGENTSSES